MDETEGKLLSQIEELEEKLSIIRSNKIRNQKNFDQYIGKCFKDDRFFGKILSIHWISDDNDCVSFYITSIFYDPENINIWQSRCYSLPVSEIDSLLIPESEFLDALNKGFEEIKKY